MNLGSDLTHANTTRDNYTSLYFAQGYCSWERE